MLKMRLLRILQGYTQWDIAKWAKISPARISMIERGIVTPSPEQLGSLARVLEAKPEELLVEVPRGKGASEKAGPENGYARESRR